MASDSGEQYRLKSITFKDREVSVVMQNVNGPCPLLALANVLLLRGSISIHSDYSQVSYDRLVTLLGDFLMERNNRQALSPELAANYEQNVFDALEQMPFLQFGFDVNVCFTSITDFEFTKGMAVFDLFNARLVHGWIYDKDDEQLQQAIGSASYNELTEKLVALDDLRTSNTEDDRLAAYGLVECFLQESASQLTDEGVRCLQQNLEEDELAIFFRNNHFSVIHKREGALYLLVTDQGFLYQKKIVWEKLESVNGCIAFVDGSFSSYDPNRDYTEQPVAGPLSPGASEAAAKKAQAVCDEELALRLQREEEGSIERREAEEADRKLAQQLHDQERNQQRHGTQVQGGHQVQPTAAAPSTTTIPSEQMTPEQRAAMMRAQMEQHQRNQAGNRDQNDGDCCIQ